MDLKLNDFNIFFSLFFFDIFQLVNPKCAESQQMLSEIRKYFSKCDAKNIYQKYFSDLINNKLQHINAIFKSQNYSDLKIFEDSIKNSNILKGKESDGLKITKKNLEDIIKYIRLENKTDIFIEFNGLLHYDYKYNSLDCKSQYNAIIFKKLNKMIIQIDDSYKKSIIESNMSLNNKLFKLILYIFEEFLLNLEFFFNEKNELIHSLYLNKNK